MTRALETPALGICSRIFWPGRRLTRYFPAPLFMQPSGGKALNFLTVSHATSNALRCNLRQQQVSQGGVGLFGCQCASHRPQATQDCKMVPLLIYSTCFRRPVGLLQDGWPANQRKRRDGPCKLHCENSPATNSRAVMRGPQS